MKRVLSNVEEGKTPVAVTALKEKPGWASMSLLLVKK